VVSKQYKYETYRFHLKQHIKICWLQSSDHVISHSIQYFEHKYHSNQRQMKAIKHQTTKGTSDHIDNKRSRTLA